MKLTIRHIGTLVFCVSLPLVGVAAQGEPTSHVYRVVGQDTLHAFVFAGPHPDAARARPSIALFHGGGWTAGSAEWTFAAAQRFAALGLVAVSVQYRLVRNDVTPREAFDDVCAFFGWLRAHTTALRIDERVAGYGVSAGGHLVAATVTVGCGLSETSSRGPDALLLWSPALDVARDGWFVGLMGSRAAAAALSPVEHVGSAPPPTSIVHGARDTLTPLRGARVYCDRVVAQGVVCELHVYEGLGHLLTRNLANQESDFDPDPVAVADGVAQHVAFLRAQGFLPSGRD